MSDITPEKLRAAATTGAGWLPIPASCGAMLADALEIADSCAQGYIECECCGSFAEGYDLTSAEDFAKETIEKSVRYLTARGLIEREGDIVRFKE